MQSQYPEDDPHKLTIGDLWVPFGLTFAILLSIVIMHFYHLPEQLFYSSSGKVGSKYDPSPLMVLMMVPALFTKKILNWYFKRDGYIEKLANYYLPEGEDTPNYQALSIFLFIVSFF